MEPDWASTVGSEFNRELGFLHTEEELKPFLEGEVPPAVEQRRVVWGRCGDVRGEGPGLSAYILSDGTVYRTYLTTAAVSNRRWATTASWTAPDRPQRGG